VFDGYYPASHCHTHFWCYDPCPRVAGAFPIFSASQARQSHQSSLTQELIKANRGRCAGGDTGSETYDEWNYEGVGGGGVSPLRVLLFFSSFANLLIHHLYSLPSLNTSTRLPIPQRYVRSMMRTITDVRLKPTAVNGSS